MSEHFSSSILETESGLQSVLLTTPENIKPLSTLSQPKHTSAISEVLSQSLELAASQLRLFIERPIFSASMNLAFGADWNQQKFQDLVQNWQKSDFKTIVKIDLLTGSSLNGANAAFSAETDTIYFSRDFLLQNAENIEAVTAVLIEEWGHRIDSKINTIDALGDEGDIFSRVVRGVKISQNELEELREENDHAKIIIDNAPIEIEMAKSDVIHLNGKLIQSRQGMGDKIYNRSGDGATWSDWTEYSRRVTTSLVSTSQLKILGQQQKNIIFDPLSSAKQISFNEGVNSVSGAVSNFDRSDIYRFDVKQTGNSYFNLSTLSADASLTLMDQEGKFIRVFNQSGAAEESGSALLTTGTYYLGIAQVSGNSTYNLSFSSNQAFESLYGGQTWLSGDSINWISGDFNGDGFEDILRQEKGAIVNGINDVQFALGKSDKSFNSFINISDMHLMHGNKSNLISGDFNGDGKTDLIRQEKESWSGNINDVQILTFKDGNFKIAASFSNTNTLNGNNVNLIASDFNADGYTDLIRQEKGSWVNGLNDVQIMLSKGGWEFADPASSNSMNAIAGNDVKLVAKGTDLMRLEMGDLVNGINDVQFSSFVNGDFSNLVNKPSDNFTKSIVVKPWESPISKIYTEKQSTLGQLVSAQASAISPYGTTGRYNSYTNGSIYWSVKTGAISVTSEIDKIYNQIGSSGSFLGVPTSTQSSWSRGVRQEFEGGYIYYDGQVARFFRPGETPLTKYKFTYFYNGVNTDSDHYTGWVIADESSYSVNSFVDPNSNNNETGINGRYLITSAMIVGSSGDAIAQSRGKVWVDRYYNRETNETFIPLALEKGLSVGSNFLGSEYGFLEVDNDIHFDFGVDICEFDRFININSPNGGQSINADSQVTINWTDTLKEAVRIDLYQGTSFITNIGVNIVTNNSNGSFTWQTPNNLSGSNYRIRVSSMLNSTLSDESDVGFSIAIASSVQVTNPNNGIAVTMGNTYTINWVDNFTENVKIDLYKGSNFYRTITNTTASNGSYSWSPGYDLAAGSDYRIRVSSVDNSNVVDFSDTYFTIANPDLKKYWFYYNYNPQDFRLADSYVGCVIAPAGKYTVAFRKADGSYDQSNVFNLTNANNEVGMNGNYLIYEVNDYDDSLVSEMGRVFVNEYIDRYQGLEKKFTPNKYSQGVQPSGLNFLGSEDDYINGNPDLGRFGRDYYEADIVRQKPDIDIQIFDPFNSFTNTWHWQAMKTAEENWERLIVADKSTSGQFRIVVTKDSSEMGLDPWDDWTIAAAYVDKAVGSRTNLNNPYPVDLGGVDYDNRITWNPAWDGRLTRSKFIQAMMHEIGHTLGLDHESLDTNSLMFESNDSYPGITESMMQTLEAQGYVVDRSAINRMQWT
jgi:hypothetical protein